MAANAHRIRATQTFQPVDRTPVWVGAYDRYYLDQRGVSYEEYFSGPEAYLYHKIINQVWAIQNMPDDRCQAPEITIYLDFENTANASAFGAEVILNGDELPWTRPVLGSPDDIDYLEVPGPDAGGWGKLLAWYKIMCDKVSNYRLVFNGQKSRIVILPPDPGSEGPFTIAQQLVGTDLYVWLSCFPEACCKLMQKITTGLIQAHKYVRRVYPEPARSSFSVVNDGAEIVSTQMFQRFCVPFDNQLYDALAPLHHF